jgi:hypothetical protein
MAQSCFGVNGGVCVPDVGIGLRLSTKVPCQIRDRVPDGVAGLPFLRSTPLRRLTLLCSVFKLRGTACEIEPGQESGGAVQP